MLISRSLADGQLPSSQGVLYVVPGAKKARISNLLLYNTDAVPQTIILLLRRSGSSARSFRSLQLSQHESASVLAEEPPIIMSDGDSLEGVTTSESAVNYYLAGIEES